MLVSQRTDQELASPRRARRAGGGRGFSEDAPKLVAFERRRNCATGGLASICGQLAGGANARRRCRDPARERRRKNLRRDDSGRRRAHTIPDRSVPAPARSRALPRCFRGRVRRALESGVPRRFAGTNATSTSNSNGGLARVDRLFLIDVERCDLTLRVPRDGNLQLRIARAENPLVEEAAHVAAGRLFDGANQIDRLDAALRVASHVLARSSAKTGRRRARRGACAAPRRLFDRGGGRRSRSDREKYCRRSGGGSVRSPL